MSKTYRRDEIFLDSNHRPFRSWDHYFEIPRQERRQLKVDYYSKKNNKRDKKPWLKCSSDFKKMLKKRRRAQVRDAMSRKDYDNIPFFRTENDWNYH